MKKLFINNFSGGIDKKTSPNLLGLNYSQNCYNFDFCEGSLKGIYPFSAFIWGNLTKKEVEDKFLALENGFQGGCVFCYKRYDKDHEIWQEFLIIFDSLLNGFYLDLAKSDAEIEPLNLSFSSRPTALNYRLDGEDVLILTSPTDQMVVLRGVDNFEIVADAPKIKSMDIHYERLFATTSGDDTELWFSDDLDPTNWSESLEDAGFISMVDYRGALNKVVSFNDYLYVFRDDGISRVYASTVSQASFYVNHLFVSGGKIFDKTIQTCGDRIMFVTTDGFYRFDGSNAHRCLEGLFPFVTLKDSSTTEYLNGKYYLSCAIDGGDKCDCVLEIDPISLNYSIYKTDEIFDLKKIGSKEYEQLVLLTANPSSPLRVLDKLSQEFECGASYESGLTTLNLSTPQKVVRKVKASVDGEVKLMLFNEKGEELEFSLSALEREQVVHFSFEKLGIKLKATKPVVVNYLEFILG